MVFMPPQHGKSEITSRRFPAWMLGKNPDIKIIGASYAATLSQKFNRDVQRIIDSEQYFELFPDTILPYSHVRSVSTGSYLRNTDEFEIIGHDGKYLGAGVGGSLTGNPADLVIIDDPIKDRAEAESPTVRNKIWDWYTDVIETRMHNDSQVLLTMTRWHEDDLAGRLIEKEGDEWTVVRFPALKEDHDNPDDPREIGEALWEERHSAAKHLKQKAKSPRTFNSLGQQRPAPVEGDMIKREWFKIKTRGEMQDVIEKATINAWIDGAYTEKTTNDPTGIMFTFEHGGMLYILASIDKYLEMHELLKEFPPLAEQNGISATSRIYIEPKASGLSLVSMLNADGYNCIKISGKLANAGKVARVSDAQPALESGKVCLIEGGWNDAFLDQCTGFPNAKHDEHVDNLGYAVIHTFVRKSKKNW